MRLIRREIRCRGRLSGGGEIKWEILGDYASLDECRNAAIARYNQSLLGRQPPRHVLGLSQEEPVWWVREPPSVKGARREGRMWARPQERRRACPRPSYSPGYATSTRVLARPGGPNKA